MEIDKTLTIIIPTYNMEKYLRKCLDSLIVSDDKMSRLEVLVVNDGSKDSSSAIAHEYEAKYPQTFRVIDKENGNYGSCVNRGLKEAAGKYVKVLDADDYFDNNVFYRHQQTWQKPQHHIIEESIFEGKGQKDVQELLPTHHIFLFLQQA